MISYKGIIHLHSNYSSDGNHTLEEIADFGRRKGYQFLAMSEHSDTLNEALVSEYVEACDRLSSFDFILIPGIEFTCKDGLHILGLGIREYLPLVDPIEVVRFINNHGGVSIIAHPIRYQCNIADEILNSVNGVEIWNVIYDGRFVPDPGVIKWFSENHKKGKSLIAYGGQDLHRITEKLKLEIIIYSDILSEKRIISALKDGNFIISNTWLKIESHPEISTFKMTQINLGRFAYKFLKSIKTKL